MLDEISELYLIHRFDVNHDKFIWPLIVEKASNAQQKIVHQDFLETLQEKPKFEPQDMHFSKKSHSLHCSIVQKSTDASENEYLYHFSDVLKQNWAYTACVDDDIETNFLGDQDIICKKSDNCGTQYKSRKVFGHTRSKAKTSGKVCILYYGPSSHGRGLVDSMSSFGVKAPLRKEIINNDFFWTESAQLVNLFQSKLMGEQLHCNEIMLDDISAKSQHKSPEYPIKGCIKLHCIAFHPDGSVETNRDICDCDECFRGKFSKCSLQTKDDEDEDDDDEDNDDGNADDGSRIDIADVFSMAQLLCFVHQLMFKKVFIWQRVDIVSIASEDVFDSYKHFVTEGMQYIECNYLAVDEEIKGKRKETKGNKFIQYKRLSRKVFVLP